MASAQSRSNILQADEYLLGEAYASVRHEFMNGHVYAMAGASEGHNTIKLNVAGALNAAIGAGCRVFDGDMKLRIERGDELRFYYPDVFVSCGPTDRTAQYREDAILVIEVLSPSTVRYDRFEKFLAYQMLPSILEYVLIEQDAPQIEVFRRRTNWQRETFKSGDTVNFESIGHAMTVEQIYRRVFD